MRALRSRQNLECPTPLKIQYPPLYQSVPVHLSIYLTNCYALPWHQPHTAAISTSFCVSMFVFLYQYNTGFPIKDARFLEIKNISDLLSDDKEGKLM